MALFGSPCKSPILTVQSPRNFGFLKSGFLISSIPTNINSQNSIPALSNLLLPFVGRSNCCISSSAGSSIEAYESPSPSKIIFVKGLPKSTSQRSLNKTFSLFGKVSRVKIVNDKRTGQSLGFGYIWFTCEECAQMAVEEMNGKFFEGKFILVTIAKPGSCKPREKTTTPLVF